MDEKILGHISSLSQHAGRIQHYNSRQRDVVRRMMDVIEYERYPTHQLKNGVVINIVPLRLRLQQIIIGLRRELDVS